ncbi:hypothetical protein GCM10022293_40500 [Azospirillum formosense]
MSANSTVTTLRSAPLRRAAPPSGESAAGMASGAGMGRHDASRGAPRGAAEGIDCDSPKSMSVPAIEAPLRSVIGMLEETISNAQTFKTRDG